MAFKLPGLPSFKDPIEEIADFWEIEAIRQEYRFLSKVDISSILSVESDETTIDGIDSDDDVIDIKLDEVLSEISFRQVACFEDKYPFLVKKHSIKLKDDGSLEKLAYQFFLLATRLNMKEQKVFNDINGTDLFEKISSLVAKNLFGRSAQSFVFGTAAKGNFKEKVVDMMNRIEDGRAFKNIDNNEPTKNDDGLDVVTWKNFADERRGKLIGFGQCKTGTTWQDEFEKLQPNKFCDNWLTDSPLLKPFPMVFLTDTLREDLNLYSQQRNYLFLNRFRMMEYLPESIDEELENDIKKWVDGAIEYIKN